MNNYIEIDSDAALATLNRRLDNVTADIMQEKADKETDPQRKRMMLLYVKRRRELENEGLLPSIPV